MPKNKRRPQNQYRYISLLLVVAGALILVISGWFWWSKVYTDPEHTFWAAVNNNLVLTGATKHIKSTNSASKLDQYQQLNLGARNITKSSVTVEQGSQAKVNTETIGTPDTEYARYTKIDANIKHNNHQLNFAPVIGQWGTRSVEQAGSSSFAEAVFDVIPFARLSSTQRHQVLDTMKQDKIYSIDFGSIERRSQDGRQIYDYTVSVSPEKYVKILKMIDADMGLKQLQGVDESQYAQSPPFQVKISVDVTARQLTNITYLGNDRVEEISAYGANADVQLPTNTISQDELQKRLNAIITS